MSVIPNTPLDRSMPPWVIPLSLSAELPPVELPGPGDTVVLDGRLESADPTAALDVVYQARARLAGRVVSNAALTDAKGNFVLRMQKSALGGAGPNQPPLALELHPADGMLPLPSLRVSPLDVTKPQVDPMRLPAFQKPEDYQVPVVDRQDKTLVVGATVRFTTEVGGAGRATAYYERSAQTGTNGKAVVPLIPGDAQKTRDYAVTVTPPPNSKYAGRCLAGYSVGPATTGGQMVGAAIELDRKVVISGRVLRADGEPAGAVRIRATRVGGAIAPECNGPLPSPPAEITSGTDGRYTLPLDPGTYRLDAEPPHDAPLPRASFQVSVPDTKIQDITLPVPVLVEGRVLSPDSAPIGDAEVRAFAAGGVVPQERAVALSGADGKFRLILPQRP
jgi:hypothetical protein